MPVYTNPIVDQEPSPKVLYYVDNKCALFTCNGSPEGVILANTGSIALSDNGSVFKKTTDDINTGWVELTGGTVSSPFVVSGTNPTISLVDTTVGDDDGTISMDADVMSIGVVGGTLLQIRSNGQIVGFARRINIDNSVVGNVGGGLDPLHSFTVPANTLAATNDEISFEGGGPIANNANTKRVAFSFDGQITVDSGLRTVTSAGASIGWKIFGTVIRLTATTVRINATICLGFAGVDSANTPNGFGAGGVMQTKTFDLTVANLTTNPVIMLFQAEATANNDVQQNLSKEYLTQT